MLLRTLFIARRGATAAGRSCLAAFQGIALAALLLPPGASCGESDGVLAKGAYLARITGCAGCHSPRLPAGEVDETRLLTGGDHPIGAGPSVRIYPPNLTPDAGTGLGGWSVEDIVKAVKSGVTPSGRVLSSAMPWRTQSSRLEESDAQAIAVYLKSLPPAANRVPPPVQGCPGRQP